MAFDKFPAVSGSWFTQVILAQQAAIADRTRYSFYNLKEKLKTGLSPWSVVSSCGKNGGGSLVAGSGDNILSPADVVYAAPGVAHSWIVLRQPEMLGGFQVCFDLWYAGSVPSAIQSIYSPLVGFSGGTTTNRPTATDEISSINWYLTPNTADLTSSIHIFRTADGKHTRFATSWTSSRPASFNIIGMAKYPLPFWEYPYVAGVSDGLYASLYSSSSNMNTTINSINTGLYFTCESVAGTAIGSSAFFNTPDTEGKWPIIPIGVWPTNQLGKGRVGEIEDLWFISDNMISGTMAPGDGTNRFVVIGDLLQPNDGTSIVFG